MLSCAWKIEPASGPLIATAIHAGHELRPAIARSIRLSAAERLREEDPYTDLFTTVAPSRVVGTRSRFEFDLNRPPEKAVYLQPEDAWGLNVWLSPLSPRQVRESLALHHRFYQELFALLEQRVKLFPLVVVLDIHSYNHQREGATAACAPQLENPDINIGTGSMPVGRWDALVETFIAGLRSADCGGRRLDVRENIRFRGGYLSQWVHEHFPMQVCAIAIEFKKIFMDEWSGVVDARLLGDLQQALAVATTAISDRFLQPGRNENGQAADLLHWPQTVERGPA